MSQKPLPPRAISAAPVPAEPAATIPTREPIIGTSVRLEPLDAQVHADDLWRASTGSEVHDRIWTHMAYGPFGNPDEFGAWLRGRGASDDPLFFAVRDLASGEARGIITFMNIHAENRTIEIGNIWFGPQLQNTCASTEALYLAMAHTFDLHYRRLEWKCDALNADSRRAATRLGFVFEGIFYQHFIVKGRNRDTAWYSLLDYEWPRIRQNFLTWLSPDNFDHNGKPRDSLAALNAMARAGDSS